IDVEDQRSTAAEMGLRAEQPPDRSGLCPGAADCSRVPAPGQGGRPGPYQPNWMTGHWSAGCFLHRPRLPLRGARGRTGPWVPTAERTLATATPAAWIKPC